MTGHLVHSGIDRDHPASLSRAWTTGVLRERLGFEGVVVVDSLDMGAVAARYAPDEALALAVHAGADLLMDCNNAPAREGERARPCPAPAMAEALRRALREGRIEGGLDRLEASAQRIRRALAARSGAHDRAL
jgi:beta-glucosidase-like glycosyl hydrolase